jgi:hypothetical protein
MNKWLNKIAGANAGCLTRTMILRTSLLAVLLACSGCIPTLNQGTPHLAGSVADAATMRPIVGARLHYAKFPKHEVFTGVDGRYDFPGINYWDYMILWPIDSDRPPERPVLTIDAPQYISTNVEVAWPDRTNSVFYLNHQ